MGYVTLFSVTSGFSLFFFLIARSSGGWENVEMIDFELSTLLFIICIFVWGCQCRTNTYMINRANCMNPSFGFSFLESIPCIN